MIYEFQHTLKPYTRLFWDEWDYTILNNSPVIKPPKKNAQACSRLIITADTETSKSERRIDNHVVIWAVHIRFNGDKVVTLYGRRPTDFCKCVQNIVENVKSDVLYIYFHNLAYDWQFLRKFIINAFKEPVNQLNLKPYSPLYIQFSNGLILRDSLPLAQRKLAKWCEDLNVKEKKHDGNDWNYSAIRHQNTPINDVELSYLEYDVVSLAECLEVTMQTLKCNITTLPLTATGVPRRDIKRIGRDNRAKQNYTRQLMPFDLYVRAEKTYHGGYTHANRFVVDELITGDIKCYDFNSSYPARMILSKMPVTAFFKYNHKITVDDIIDNMDDRAFFFDLCLVRPCLKTGCVMPSLQLSKAEKVINPLIDNGRILQCDYIRLPLTEMDLKIIVDTYDFDRENTQIINVYIASKGYLPRWFTDYIYSLYYDKCTLKSGDAVLYQIQKAKLNACYGMCVQKCVKYDIKEDYQTGKYKDVTKTTGADGEPVPINPEELYNKYTSKYSVILPYQIGIWVTSCAMYELFKLGEMCTRKGEWLYTDTDSVYCIDMDTEALRLYNEDIEKQLIKRGYEPVIIDGNKYVIGQAVLDGEYTEFKTQGAKRYVVRKRKDNTIKITVAGVPKSTGAECLKNDLNNFVYGFIFDGATTGKLEHEYKQVESVYIDEDGNECGDSIDLTPADYTLSTANIDDFDIDNMFYKEIKGTDIYE